MWTSKTSKNVFKVGCEFCMHCNSSCVTFVLERSLFLSQFEHLFIWLHAGTCFHTFRLFLIDRFKRSRTAPVFSRKGKARWQKPATAQKSFFFTWCNQDFWFTCSVDELWTFSGELGQYSKESGGTFTMFGTANCHANTNKYKRKEELCKNWVCVL
jgi:hypothetical protein